MTNGWSREEILKYHKMNPAIPEPEYKTCGMFRACVGIAMFFAYVFRQHWLVRLMGRMP